MNRRNFLSGLAVAVASVPMALHDAASEGQCVIRRVRVLRVEGHRTQVFETVGFKDLKVGDKIVLLDPQYDELCGKCFNVVEGPKPTEDPSTQGRWFVTVEEAV